jgi:hypothetical protein
MWLNMNFGLSLEPGNTSTFAFKPPNLRKEYLEALQAHVNEDDCHFCMKVHTLRGESFCSEIESMLAQARNIRYSFSDGILGV